MYFLKVLLRALLKFLICIVGWRLLDPKIPEYFKAVNKSMLIYPHTTYWDFVVLLLYKYAYEVPDLYVVVNEGIYKKYPKIFDLIGCFPATAKERNNGGFVANTVEKFKNMQKYHILISPEGTFKKVPWRSGYFHLAEKLNIPIHIFGFDYLDHTMIMITNNYMITEKVNKGLNVNDESIGDKEVNFLESVQERLRTDISKIVPLYPEGSDVQIITNSLPTPVDYCTLTTLSLPLYSLIGLYDIHKNSFYLLCIAYIFSFLYHHTHETKYKIIEPISVTISFLHLKMNMWILDKLIIDFWTILFIIFGAISFYKGSGRHCSHTRSKEYIIYHTLFHVWIGAWTTYETYYNK